MQIATKAMVLSVRDLDEGDRLLTLLTEDRGVISAYAKGAGRLKNQLAPSTNLLCCSHVILFKNKDRYTLDSADSIEMFFGLRKDLDRLALATYLAEITQTLAPHEEPAAPSLRLLLNTLYLLEKGSRSAAFLKPVYELRAMAMGGYMPDLVACRECACYEHDVMYLLLQSGELVCGSCFVPGAQPAVPLGRGVLAAMRHIVYSDAKKLFAFTLPEPALQQLGQATERFLLYQTDRTYHSLEFYHSLLAI